MNPWPQWVCIYTKPRNEVLAKFAFDALQLEAFLPMAKVRSHKRGDGYMLRPIFPRYLFARVDGEQQIAWIIRRKEVVAILSQDGRPTPVPQGVIDSLKVSMIAGTFDERRKSPRAGDRVRISRGPFSGFIGKLWRLKAQDRGEI